MKAGEFLQSLKKEARCRHCGEPIRGRSGYCGYCQVVLFGKRDDNWPPLLILDKKADWEKTANF